MLRFFLNESFRMKSCIFNRDRSLIRENLRLSVAERFENLMSLQRFAAELRGGMKKALSR